jgi:osmotically-inducible protein OsmY
MMAMALGFDFGSQGIIVNRRLSSMKNFIILLVLVIAVLVGFVWYYSDRNPHAQQAKSNLEGAATQTREFVQDKLGSVDLSSEHITQEMAQAGEVVRRKSMETGNAVADATADARVTAAIKAKLVADPELSALKISVNTTAGRVTLSGTASSPDKIRKAIQLAMDTDGVREVVSTIQVAG